MSHENGIVETIEENVQDATEIKRDNEQNHEEPSNCDLQEQELQDKDQLLVQDEYKMPEFSKRPQCLARKDFDRFTKGCKWSPDGLCILMCCDDHSMQIFDLPNDMEKGMSEAAVKVKENENIYDYQWYSLMNSNKPETCAFATTAQHQPIHLYDAFDGHIRGTYRCFNHLDEMEAARSLCFNPSGSKLVAGMKNQIRIFDTAIPGRDCDTVVTFDKTNGGLSGIISSIAVSTTRLKS